MNPGKLIKQYRDKSNMTQLELATKLGYDIPQFISLIENGHSSLPLNVANKVIKILKIPKQEMIECLKNEYLKQIEKALK